MVDVIDTKFKSYPSTETSVRTVTYGSEKPTPLGAPHAM